MNIQKYTGIYATSGDVREAVSAGTLHNPYIAIVQDGNYIDWNGNSSPTPPVPPEPVYSAQPLTFEILSAGTIMWMAAKTSFGSESKELHYSKNGGNWETIFSSSAGTPINVEAGDEVRVKANGIEGSVMANMISTFKGSTCYFNLRGNIASMVDEDNYQNITVFENNKSRVTNLFQGTNVVDASKLILPFTVFRKNSVYENLFAGCKKLISAPELPAAVFEDTGGHTSSIYYGMFQNCISLTRAPKLPTRTLCDYCYSNMFNGCTSLNYVECMADTTIGYSTFNNWLNGVAATGTFVKHPDATWATGVSGIPDGWTVQDA